MGNPYITGFPFGAGNFPAGANPWNGQVAAVNPGVDLLTPDTVLDAETVNYLLNQRDNALLYVNSAVGPYQILEDSLTTGGSPRGQAGTGTQGSPYLLGGVAWTGSTFTAGNTVSLATCATNTQVGDVIDLEFQGSLALDWQGGAITNGCFDALADLFVNQNGAGFVDTTISASWIQKGIYLSTTTNNYYPSSPVSLRGRWTIASGHAGTFAVGINGCLSLQNITLGSGLFALLGSYATRIRHLRPY